MWLHSTRTNYPNSKPSSISSYSLILTVWWAENQPIFKALFELTRDRIHCLPHANLAALMMLCTVIRKHSSFVRNKLYMCFYYTPHNTKFNNKLPHNQQNITSFSKYKIDYGYRSMLKTGMVVDIWRRTSTYFIGFSRVVPQVTSPDDNRFIRLYFLIFNKSSVSL